MDNTQFQARYGLKPTPPSKLDFQLGKYTDLPPLSDLPDQFDLGELEVLHQKGSDYCSAFSSCMVSSLQEGILPEPSWSFAVSKKLSGDPDEFGQDLRTACAAHTKHGYLPKSEAPYSLENKDDSFLRRIENWPDLFKKAEPQKKKTYFKVTGPYDHFDNIRATLFHYSNEKRAIMLGTIWGWSLNDVFMEEYKENGFGHAIFAKGWILKDGKQYLTIQNSYGKEAGKNGLHYFGRDVINKMVEQFGAYMFLDEDPKQIQKEQWTLRQRIMQALKKILEWLHA